MRRPPKRWLRRRSPGKIALDLEMISTFDDVIESALQAAGDVVMDEARALYADSQTRVPVDEGVLKASGHIGRRRASVMRVATHVGYSRPVKASGKRRTQDIAMIVHEMPGPGHKFLERPARSRARNFGRRVAESINREVARARA